MAWPQAGILAARLVCRQPRGTGILARATDDQNKGARLVFNSLTFIVFFAIVLLLHRCRSRGRRRRSICWSRATCSTRPGIRPSSSCCGSRPSSTGGRPTASAQAQRPRRRTARLAADLGLRVNLGMLGYFKYGEFLLAELAGTDWQSIGIDYRPPAFEHHPAGRHLVLHLPDHVLHARRLPAARRSRRRAFLDFALFVTFFPHLVAGPIVRPSRARAAVRARRAGRAGTSSLWGLALMIARPVQEGRDRRRRARRSRPTRCSADTGAVGVAGRLARHAGLLAARSSATSPATRPSRSARRCAWASRCRTTSACRTRRSASPTSGAAGTSRCRRGCATTCTSRSAATAAARRAPTST